MSLTNEKTNTEIHDAYVRYRDTKTFYQNECQKYLEQLESEYKDKQKEYQTSIQDFEKKLDELAKKYQASVEARVREKEIAEKQSFYCLQIDEIDLADIQLLEKIKPRLNKPRILSMLIWSTYYQKSMTILCNNILGTKDITGIYKITNQKTNECYIG